MLGGYVVATPLARADMAAAQTAIASGNFPAAGAALQPLAQNGDAQAQYQWAALALDGHPVGLTPERAISFLIQSAAQGNSHAQARLGMAYAKGDHIAVDDFAAYHWLSRASAAPDLTSEERSNVMAVRQSLLDVLAPTQKNYVADSSGNADSSQQNGVPSADKAQAAPAGAVSAAPLSDATPSAEGQSKITDASDTTGQSDTSAKAQTDEARAAEVRAAETQTAEAQAGGKTAATATATSSQASAKKDTTAAVKAKPPSAEQVAGASTVTADPSPAARKYVVQLASLTTETSATAEADRLRKKYASIIADTEISIRQADLGSKGIRQRVVAGPFDSFDAAKAHCVQFSAQKQACRVIPVAD